MNDLKQVTNMREYGKQLRQFILYLSKVRSGEKGLIISTDYVVMDRKTYNKLNNFKK